MKVTLIIPARNESGCIGRVLGGVPRNLVNQIIVVDGNSTDQTVSEAERLLKPQDKLIIQQGFGYGSAFLQGFPFVTGNVIVMMDADGSHNPKDIPKLIAKIKAGNEYVMASRYAPGGRSEDDTWFRFFGNKLFTWITNIIHGTKVTDSLYLFTAITKTGLDRLHLSSMGFEFCTEIIVRAHQAGLKFTEVPVTERARFTGKSKVNALWHGFKILRSILKTYND